MRSIRKRKACLAMFFAAFIFVFNISMVSVCAKNDNSNAISAPSGIEDKLCPVYGFVGDEPYLLSAGVGVEGKENCYFYSGLTLSDYASQVDALAYVASDGYAYRLGTYSKLDNVSMLQFEVADADKNSSFVKTAEGHKGDKVWACYVDSQSSLYTVEGELTGIKESGEYYVFETKGISISDFVGVVPLFNEDGNCVGIMGENGTVLALETTTDSFKGGMSSKTIIIVVAVIAVVVLGAFMMKKKNGNAQAASQDMEQPGEFRQPDFGQPNFSQPDFGQPAVPQPVNFQPSRVPGRVSMQIHCRGGKMDGRIYTATANEILIGRDSSSFICYPADTKGISRIHCKLYLKDGKWMIMDMGSSYGTFVEGRGRLIPQQPVEIKNGDCFYLGGKDNAFKIQL